MLGKTDASGAAELARDEADEGKLAGLLEAVPLIGPTLGSLPAIIVALSVSPQTALLVVIYMLIVQVSENNIIAPRLLGHSVGVSRIGVAF